MHSQTKSEAQTKSELYSNLRSAEESQFWIGNPSIDLISGHLTFYPYQNTKGATENTVRARSNILAAVSIPNFKGITEVYSFFRENDCNAHILRIMKTTSMDFYTILMKFENDDDSTKFFITCNEKKFNQIESDRCILREVKEVTIKVEKADINFSRNDSTDKSVKSEDVSICSTSIHDIFYLSLQKNISIRKTKQWQSIKNDEATLYCPICLEKILTEFEEDKLSPTLKKASENLISITKEDPEKEIESLESTAIIGILCGHFFHMGCLEKWNDNVCPVCRYYQHPTEHSKCDVCGSDENLWMCIICGFIGCCPSGPAEGHIREHYEQTKHIYSKDVESNSVYDFSRSSFVHRLLQNAIDGKIIQHDTDNFNDGNKKYQYGEFEKKVDSMQYEYNQFFSTQHQLQKNYYEGKFNEIQSLHEEQKKITIHKLDVLMPENQELKSKFNEFEKLYEESRAEFFKLKDQNTELMGKKLNLDKENKALAKKQDTFGEETKTNNDAKSELIKKIREEIASTAGQIKDIEMHLSAKSKIKKALGNNVENEGAHIILSGGTGGTKPKKHSKKK